MYASLHRRQRNYRLYLVSSARNVVSKRSLRVQVWLVSKGCFVVKLAEVSCLISYDNTVLKSRLTSPGWTNMTQLNVQESLVGKLTINWTTLRTFAPKMSPQRLFFKLALQKGNDLKKMGVTDFVLERTCPEKYSKSDETTLLANKATVSVSPKILQLDLWSEMFSVKWSV